MKRHYGWRPQRPDHRDFRYNSTRPLKMALAPLPAAVDLRPYCPPVYDQGNLGSCTANAIAGAYSIESTKQYVSKVTLHSSATQANNLSRLFIYYQERLAEGTVDSDAGAVIRDGIKVLAKIGAPLEDLWPYDISNFAQNPNEAAYADAPHHRAVLYASVRSNHFDMCTALADGYPVVFGFTVFESFESAKVARTGIVPYPKADESVLGGHAVVAVGYDQVGQNLLVRNSWGDSWGMDGYFLMPFTFLENLVSDCWVIKSVL